MGMGALLTTAWPAGYVKMLVLHGRMQSSTGTQLQVTRGPRTDLLKDLSENSVQIAAPSRCICLENMAPVQRLQSLQQDEWPQRAHHQATEACSFITATWNVICQQKHHKHYLMS